MDSSPTAAVLRIVYSPLFANGFPKHLFVGDDCDSGDAVVMVTPSLLTPLVLAWWFHRCLLGYSRGGLDRLVVARTHRVGGSPIACTRT